MEYKNLNDCACKDAGIKPTANQTIANNTKLSDQNHQNCRILLTQNLAAFTINLSFIFNNENKKTSKS